MYLCGACVCACVCMRVRACVRACVPVTTTLTSVIVCVIIPFPRAAVTNLGIFANTRIFAWP